MGVDAVKVITDLHAMLFVCVCPGVYVITSLLYVNKGNVPGNIPCIPLAVSKFK